MERVIPAVENLLARLVACPSVNPAVESDPAISGESRMVAVLEETLRPWADEVVILEVAPGRANFLARFHGADRTRCLAFEAHSDTVGIEGMTVDPFAGRIEAGRLYGRGACDTKGSMAAMLLAILHEIERHGRPPTDLLFISTCDEELGGLGARSFVENGFVCDGIIVGEPTGLVPVASHKGASRFVLRVHGRAAHSAYPELGANAVHAAAALVGLIDQTFRDLAGRETWLEPGPPTASIGTFHGGEQVNRVPDSAAIALDIRIPPGWGREALPALLEKCVERVEASAPGIRIEMRQTQSYPAFRLEKSSPFYGKAAMLAPDGVEMATARYATNAGFFARGGIPCVVFGPGSPADAHTADESIDLAEVSACAAMLGRFIRE